MTTTDPSESWLALRRSAARADAEVDRVLSTYCDVRRDTYLALAWLFQSDAHRRPVSPRGLERAVNLTQSGTSRLLARMEEDALITRSASKADRRAIEVSLRPSGVERLKRAQPFVTDVLKDVLGGRSEHKVRLDTPSRQADDAELAPAPDETLSLSGIPTWHTVDAVTAADAHVVQQAIEPSVLAEAARYATDAAINDLTKAVVEMVRSTGDPAAFFAADSRFHARIGSLCQNRILRDVYQHVIERLETGVRSVEGGVESLEPYLAHRAKIYADLVDAISRHDMEAVAAAAHKHRLVRIAAENDLATLDPVTERS